MSKDSLASVIFTEIPQIAHTHRKLQQRVRKYEAIEMSERRLSKASK